MGPLCWRCGQRVLGNPSWGSPVPLPDLTPALSFGPSTTSEPGPSRTEGHRAARWQGLRSLGVAVLCSPNRAQEPARCWDLGHTPSPALRALKASPRPWVPAWHLRSSPLCCVPATCSPPPCDVSLHPDGGAFVWRPSPCAQPRGPGRARFRPPCAARSGAGPDGTCRAPSRTVSSRVPELKIRLLRSQQNTACSAKPLKALLPGHGPAAKQPLQALSLQETLNPARSRSVPRGPGQSPPDQLCPGNGRPGLLRGLPPALAPGLGPPGSPFSSE